MSSPSALTKVNYLVIRHLHFESVLGDLQEGNGCASRCQLPLSLVPIPTFRAQNWHFCALLPVSFSRWWFLGAPSRALSAESPAERQLCCSDTRKSVGPSAPIAYAASVSPPNETAACRGAQVPRSIIGRKLLAEVSRSIIARKLLAGVPRSIFGKSLLAETDQNPHKEAVYKEAAHKETVYKKPGSKKSGTKNRAQRKLCTEESVLETGIEPVRTFLPTGF